jgi:branched-chain amino acid transport system ATP-binding protein
VSAQAAEPIKVGFFAPLTGNFAAPNGKVEFDGANITGTPAFKRARRGLALVPESRRLFPEFSVEENLRIGAINRPHADDEKDVDEICVLFPVLPKRLHQRANTLSGGEGQMLAIGRALMSRPRLLLLDEPSVGLMPKVVGEIFEMIRAISRQGKTVLLVEQNARKALSVADRVAVLEVGCVVLEGEVAQLRDDPRIQEAYLGG